MKRIRLFFLIPLLSFALCASAQDHEGDRIVKSIECSEHESVADVLGEDWDDVDSLSVTGYLHASDLVFLHSCNLYGRLTGMDLSGCRIENDEIPKLMFRNYEPVSRKWVIGFRYIRLPEGLKRIGAAAFGHAGGYLNCGLKEIHIPSTVTEIEDEAFYGNRIATGTVKIPEGVTDLNRLCFGQCNNITHVQFPSTLKYIYEGAFDTCLLLEEKGDLFIPEGVEELGSGAFSTCYMMYGVWLPSSLTYISNSVFMNCSKLNKVHNYPYGLGYISKSCFWNCRLEYWTFPDDITWIGAEAFGQNAFHELILPDNIDEIGRWAFIENGNLTKIRLPKNLMTIGDAAFAGCVNLKEVYAQNPEPPSNPKGADDYVDMIGTRGIFGNIHPEAVLYVPVGAKDAYMRAGWNEWFADVQEYDYATEMSVVQADESVTVSRHALDGTRLQHPTRGLNIIRMKDGSVKKVMVR